MDYSQFLFMQEELSLLAVILIVFLADLFLCGKDERGEICPEGTCACASGMSLRTMLPVVLMLIHTAANLLPWCGSEACITEAFGGMYSHTPMMTIIKSVLNVGVIIVFLMASSWLGRSENRIKSGEFHSLVLFTLLGMY